MKRLRLSWTARVLALASSALLASTLLPLASTAAADPLTFYEVYQGCPTDPFWVAVNNGATAAAKTLGVKLVISAPTQCGSIPNQESLLTAAIDAHPAGIALSVVSPTAFSKDIQEAAKLGIPLVAYNTQPHKNNATANPYEAYIGQPNFLAGEGVGQHAISAFHLKSGDTVVVANHEPTNISLNSRYDGIKTSLNAAGIKAVELNTTTNVSQGIQIMKAYLTAHGKPAAILTLGPLATAEVVGALTSKGLTGKVGIGAFDLDAATLHYIEHGVVAFTDDQQPFLEGFDALLELYQQAKWKAQPVNIITGPVYLTPHNVKALAPLVNETGF